jgi:Peptidase family M23/Viral BACON domain
MKTPRSGLTLKALILLLLVTSCGQNQPSVSEKPNDSTLHALASQRYNLPYAGTHQVEQGPNGSVSHTGALAWAIDFDLTYEPVRSIGNGTVVKVERGNDLNYSTSRFAGYGSWVLVRLEDGNHVVYGHLGGGGGRIDVNDGDRVVTGQQLGISGHNGYTVPPNAPHLHVELLDSAYGTSTPLRFLEVQDSSDGIPINGHSYTSGSVTPPPPCNPAPSAFTHEISDNSGNFHTGGLYPQYWWHDGSNGSGGDSAFSYSVTGSQENYAWWDVNVSSTGIYDVYAFIPVGNGGSGLTGYPTQKAIGASYNLEVAGGSPRLASVQINQEGVCGWVKLFTGSSLTAGKAYAVSMGDSVGGSNPANRRIYYDNIALIKTGGGTDPPPPPACADPGLTVATSDESGFTRGGLYPQYWYTEGTNGGGGRSTFTYTVNGGDQNFAAWDLNPTIAGIYDVYVYSPTPTEDTRPLGSYGNQNPAVGVIYELLSNVGNEVAASARMNQTRGCWQKVMANISLAANGNYALRLGDNVTGAADSKLYFDTVGLKLVQPNEVNWVVTPGALTFTATVGNSPANQTFAITNNGNVSGTFGMGSSNNALVTASGYATTLAAGASTTATVTVGQCSVVGTTTGQLTINGSNKSATVAITRVCSPVPTTTWQASPTNLNFSDTVGGGAPAAKTFGLSNPGANGTYSISSNQTWLTASPASAILNSGQNSTINVTVSDCSGAITENGVLTISGGGSTASVNVTRTCTAPAPSTPSLSSITMSSNGRIFIAWPEVSGATQYDFQATFNSAAISVTGQAPNRGGTNGSAVATFLSAPDAADKQGKQVCFSMRATNTGGSSAFSSFACTTYKYYAGGLSVQSSSDVPRLTLK